MIIEIKLVKQDETNDKIKNFKTDGFMLYNINM